MLLVADRTQDIYGTANAWTDIVMDGCGFRGPWNEFKHSYRLPPTLIPHVRYFAESFLEKDLTDLPVPPQMELALHPCRLRWVQTTPTASAKVCADEILAMARHAEPDILAIPDTTFITDSRKLGAAVVSHLYEKNVKAIHTFGDTSQEERRKKLAFFLGDARVKATTLHSFKGWESRAIVLHVGRGARSGAAAIIYTGMTRLKRHPEGSFLTIVCSAPDLETYGRSWPGFVRLQ